MDFHFIKEKIEERTISLFYAPTTLQTTNILIKTLFKTNFEEVRSKLGMINIYNPACGGMWKSRRYSCTISCTTYNYFLF